MVFINLAVLGNSRNAEEEWNLIKNYLKDGNDTIQVPVFNLLSESKPGPLTFQMLSGVDSDIYITEENFFVRYYDEILERASSRINSKKLVPLLSKIFVVDGGNATLLYKSLIVLIDLLKECRVPSTKADNICAILTRLFTSDFISSALVRECVSTFDQNCWEDLIQLIVSYPSRLANSLKSHTPKFFSSENCVRVLFANVIEAVQILTDCFHFEKVEISNVGPLSSMISKILVNFNCVTEFERVIGVLERSCQDNIVHQTLVRRIIFNLEGSAIGHAALAVLSVVNSASVEYFFGDSIIRNSKWKYCLCDVFFFKMVHKNDRVLKNLVSYLRSFGDVLFEIFVDLLAVWSDRTWSTRTSFEQHLYVSKAVILCSESLFPAGIEKSNGIAEKIERKLFLGVPVHLESPEEKMRAVGMIVAEHVLGKVYGNSRDTINFDYAGMLPSTKAIVEQLRTLPSAADDSSTPSNDGIRQIDDHVRGAHPVTPSPRDCGYDAETLEISSESRVNTTNGDWDSDDELESYDLSNDVKTFASQKPLHLRDLLDGLSDKNKADVWIGSLENCETIIKTQLHRNDPCVGIEILSLLLTLERTFCVENFETLRYSAAVSIVNVYPEECAPYLCEEFHQPPGKYTITHKTLMLDILAGSARALSALENNGNGRVYPSVTRGRHVQKKEELEWQRIVRERIEQNTKFKSRPRELITRVNNFNSSVGTFFYPLLRGSCKYVARSPQNLIVGVAGLDWYALQAHYIDTLGILMSCAANCFSVTKMALELIEFTKALRFHVNSTVRCSVLRCTGSVLVSVPRSAFDQPEIANMARDIREWTEAIVHSRSKLFEQNADCCSLAEQVLALCCTVLL